MHVYITVYIWYRRSDIQTLMFFMWLCMGWMQGYSTLCYMYLSTKGSGMWYRPLDIYLPLTYLNTSLVHNAYLIVVHVHVQNLLTCSSKYTWNNAAPYNTNSQLDMKVYVIYANITTANNQQTINPKNRKMPSLLSSPSRINSFTSVVTLVKA